jgi:Kef-type K+ transport system membrane component KefB
VIRRLLILALLFGAVQMLIPLGQGGQGSQALLGFGFLILASYTTGEMAISAKLPAIVGYLVAGMVFGPYALGTVTSVAVARLAPIDSIAIALIAFIAGAELRWEHLRKHSGGLLKILSVEMTLTLLAIGGLVFLLRDYVPFLQGASMRATLAYGLVFTAIAVTHSPSVTVALLSETKASGDVARGTLGVVLVSDIAVVILFSLSQAVARWLVPPADGTPALSPGLIAWEIAGAPIVGIAFGLVVSYATRYVQREQELFALLVAFFGAQLAAILHVETLLTLMTAGFVAENVARAKGTPTLLHSLERSAAPVFVVFFALAGANIDVQAVVSLALLVIPIVLVRGVAIWGGTRIGTRWAQSSEAERRYLWMGLISQAGVSIGLATIVAQTYPTVGGSLRALLLAVMAVNGIGGAILFRQALVRAGEAK